MERAKATKTNGAFRFMLPMIKGSLPDFAPVFEAYTEDLERAAEGSAS
jgi:hypothetical protein